MELLAYALNEEHDGTITRKIDGETVDEPVYTGGLIAAGDKDFDVRAELDDGDGTIVIDPEANPALVDALDQYPALKRVKVPAGRGAGSTYSDRTIPRLRTELEARGITGHGSSTKPELVAALEHSDALTGADVDVPAGSTVADLMALEA